MNLKYWAWLGLAVCCLVGCRMPRPHSEEASRACPPQVIRVPAGVTPKLAAGEARRIAHAYLAAKGTNFRGYECTELVYLVGSDNGDRGNKWLICFRHEPRSVDMEFFVSVNDESGQAELLP